VSVYFILFLTSSVASLFAPVLEELHSCGVTIGRGPHKSSEAIPLYIEGEGGTHTIVAKERRRGEHEGSERSGREVE